MLNMRNYILELSPKPGDLIQYNTSLYIYVHFDLNKRLHLMISLSSYTSCLFSGTLNCAEIIQRYEA